MDVNCNGWYVIRCNPNKADNISYILNKDFKESNFRYFMKEIPFNRKRGIVRKTLPLFPGYFFIHDNPLEVTRGLRTYLPNDHIFPICLESNSFDKKPSMIRPSEMKRLLDCIDNSGKIPILNILKNGDNVEIMDGVFKNKFATISCLDDKGRYAIINLPLFGKNNSVKIGINLLEKR